MPISNEVVYQHPRNSSKCFLVVLSVIRTVSKRWHSLWGLTQRKWKLSVCFRHQLTSITASCIKYNSKQMYEHIVKIPQYCLGLSVPLPIYLPVYLAFIIYPSYSLFSVQDYASLYLMLCMTITRPLPSVSMKAKIKVLL